MSHNQLFAKSGQADKHLRRNCDFELKNGSGFYLQGLIAGESFIPTT